MKYLAFFSFTLLVGLVACGQPDRSKVVETTDKSTKIQLIDFYGTHRCMTCEAIEENAKYTVDNFFAQEVQEGKLEFMTVNVDKDENYAMAEKFEAAGTALFLNVIKEGQENHIDLNNFAFKKGLNKEEFTAELKAKITEQLATL